jgi:hypothetical protein
MWPKFGKDPIYRTKVMRKRSCCQKLYLQNCIVTVTLTFDPKINTVLPLPQGNHVAKLGKDPIYRTKVIVRKPVWTPARRTQSHNTARLEMPRAYKNCLKYVTMR